MSYCNDKFDENGNLTNPLLMYTYLLQQGKGITVDGVNEKDTFLSKEQEEQARACVKDVRGIVTSEQTVPFQEACGKMAKPLSTPVKQEDKEGKSL